MDNLYGEGLVGEIQPTVEGVLCKKFLVPPFSVLNAREGWWQKRKNAWLALGLEADLGRGERATWSDGYKGPGRAISPVANYSTRARGGRDQNLTWAASSIDFYRVKEGEVEESVVHSTSIFDPVLAELCYTWWSPCGGQVVDPFAGGAVRGIVAQALGRQYWGCELRPEQVESNERQAVAIVPNNRPTWACGDAAELIINAPNSDFILSCPPYGGLERYSEDPRDLSNMDFNKFKRVYSEIIGDVCAGLKRDRFACFVVGDYRDCKTGCYRNFVSGTIAAFVREGLQLYNEAILVTMVASLSMRVQAQFDKSRKLGKSHQNILVFVKGDPRKATEYINSCENSLS